MTSEQVDILVAGMMFLGVGVVVGWAGTYLWCGMKRRHKLNRLLKNSRESRC